MQSNKAKHTVNQHGICIKWVLSYLNVYMLRYDGKKILPKIKTKTASLKDTGHNIACLFITMHAGT